MEYNPCAPGDDMYTRLNHAHGTPESLNPWNPWVTPGGMFNYRLGSGRGLNYKLHIGSGPAIMQGYDALAIRSTTCRHGSEFNCRLCICSEVTYRLHVGTLLAGSCAIPIFKFPLFSIVHCITLPEQTPQDTNVRPKNFILNNSAPSTRPPFRAIVSNTVLFPHIFISLKINVGLKPVLNHYSILHTSNPRISSCTCFLFRRM